LIATKTLNKIQYFKKLKEKEQLEMDLEEKKSADKLKSKATLVRFVH
jgi:hypothetical protein